MIWLLLIFCIPLCFMLAGTESALLVVSRVRVRHAAEEGDKKAAKLSQLLQRRDELLHVVAATNHICGLLAFAAAALLTVRAVGPWGWAINLLITLPLFLIILEQIPKHLFAQKPFRSLRACTGLLTLMQHLALPWLALSSRLKSRALDLLPVEVSDNTGLDDLTKSIKTNQLLPPPCLQLIDHYADFQKSPVSRFMLPLRQLTAIPPELPLAQFISANKQQLRPWHIVLAENGNLLGWLDTTALPTNPQPDRMVRQYLRPLNHVRSTDTALHCLQYLRKRGEPLTAVHDENRHVVGVITQQSLLAAIFHRPAS
ncbi:DUF21 domain-containing protein [Phragmitibacter flavus]|uniref:DUF21 domain-containing protein n=1 Tax=Phragmitibacter flavus TaxID=2576071 RepID=A0A5R8KDC7_9BACT|nr:CNNM domain-containing protein [Phragmitibacter flavus]TLD69925.1 DUF21 domain-containing protein [Phragmitibacter flavus]